MASRPAQPLDEAIAQYLREAAHSGPHRLTLTALAAKVDIPMNTFRHYYRGNRPMATSDFVAYCDALKLPAQQVIDGARNLIAVPSTLPTMFWH